MTGINEELAEIGEPLATDSEQELATLLDSLLEQLEGGRTVAVDALPGFGKRMIESASLLYDCAASVFETLESSNMRFRDEALMNRLPNPFPGEFEFTRLLGEGAFGKVWLANDIKLDRQVAMKTVRLPDRNDTRLLKALENEAKLLAKIHHPNVVQVHAWRDARDESFLMLQYVAGGSFADRIRNEGALVWHQAARYIADVGEGLIAVHKAGIVHRDIKPANILWNSASDEAFLTDFGVSNRIIEARTVAGTPLYMAPEAFDGRATPASDVFSLAATLYCLVTGAVPFTGTTWVEIYERILAGLPDPDPRCSVLPARIEGVIRPALSPHPQSRPALDRFIQDLRAALNQEFISTLSAGIDGRPQDLERPNLQIVLSRLNSDGEYVALDTDKPREFRFQRDIKRVPPQPNSAKLSTGDRLRIEISSSATGYLNVFNVGPTGNLNLLFPNSQRKTNAPPDVRAGASLLIAEAEVSPPAGRERILAVWSAKDLPFSVSEMLGKIDGGIPTVSSAYRATRDIIRIKDSLRTSGPTQWCVTVLELDHS